jgi:hypothetical protein
VTSKVIQLSPLLIQLKNRVRYLEQKIVSQQDEILQLKQLIQHYAISDS